MHTKRSTVFVGLSGGVDSAVAALRLKNEGYNVVGVFIKVWHPPFLECDWERERLDAMRVAAHLGIPFLTCDAVDAYKQEVADYFIAEYSAGRTPNPDVLCNKAVKFGRFIEFATEHNADYVATGHYVRKSEADSRFQLLRGVDTNKDQSYFLWTLTQTQLQSALFPIGKSPKKQIRAEALRARIPVAEKRDSQGICFLGHIDIPEFISHYTQLEEGAVLDTTGSVIGSHKGALVYTTGQRHGFTIVGADGDTRPHYVISRDITKNTITVSTKPPQLQKTHTVVLDAPHWIAEAPQTNTVYTAQWRYRQKPFPVTILNVDAQTVTIAVQDTVAMPAAGQSCVLYDGERCCGGGIIAS